MNDDQKSLDVAVRGIVPCLVKGPFKSGDTVGCDENENIAKVGGERIVGTIEHSEDYDGEKNVVARVRLGKGGGAPAVGCTNLKLSLTKEDDKYMLGVSPGMVNNTPFSYSGEVTEATKVWIVVDAEVGVETTEEFDDFTGDPTLVHGYDGSVTYSNYRILLQEDDPTNIPITQPTSPNNIDMVFAMLAGEILSEEIDGETIFSLGATRCGHRTIKWCSPLSVYFLPI